MATMSWVSAIAVIGTVAALVSLDASQGDRNAVAQAALAKVVPVPAYAQSVNAQIAKAAAASSPAAVGPNAPAAIAAGGGMTLRSVGFDFPASDRALPAGEHVDLVMENCVACHSPGMIMTQPKLTAATWTTEVNKMRSVYKAPVPDEAVPQIVAYLAAMPVGK